MRRPSRPDEGSVGRADHLYMCAVVLGGVWVTLAITLMWYGMSMMKALIIGLLLIALVLWVVFDWCVRNLDLDAGRWIRYFDLIVLLLATVYIFLMGGASGSGCTSWIGWLIR
jgi:hypothetical protein